MALIVLTSATGRSQESADDLSTVEQAAFLQAAAEVAPSVVQIQPLGGLEKVDGRLVTSGPTTGLIVGQDGWIVTTQYGLSGQPASILVTLPDGRRVPGRQVAVDHSRELVLLKVESDSPLPVPQVVDPQELRVGQWAIAVGRTFSQDQVNLSVGIVSAKDRGWGRAVQTDAKISPNNYGGPLVDLQGRVLGILSPLSSSTGEGMEEIELYDSGIGFAVPMTEVLRRLPQWQEGRDLHPGRLGISMRGGDLYGSPPVIGTVFPTSPAQKAGLKSGDRIVSINDRAVARQSEFKQTLEPLYAGDTVRLSVDRSGQTQEFSVELIDKLPPYRRPWLGILPVRKAVAESGSTEPAPDGKVAEGPAAEGDKAPETDKPAGSDDSLPGVVVRHVMPDSPAAAAGLQPGDRITAVDGQEVRGAAALRTQVLAHAPDDRVALKWMRGESSQQAEVVLANTRADVPDALPAPAELADGEGDRPEVGKQSLKLPEESAECFVWLPDNFNGVTPFGLLVLLPEPGDFDAQKLIDQWGPVCRERHWILMAPEPTDRARWTPADVFFVLKAIPEAVRRYGLDRQRIACWGDRTGGLFAYTVAIQLQEYVRGVVPMNSGRPARSRLPMHLPENPLSILFAYRAGQGEAVDWEASLKEARQAEYPAAHLPLASPDALTDDERSAILRWLDTLDRI
ncbi:MAG: PDZ domain-containing protein [Pirellulales bacterium]